MLYDLTNVPTIPTEHLSLFDSLPNKLFGIDTDTKTIKGTEFGVATGIMYLSPANSSGTNVCPMAEIAKCKEPCLNTAGRGMFGTVQASRLRKTLFWLQYPTQFKVLLRKELDRLLRYASKRNLLPACRLNGTSDIRWENYIWPLMSEYAAKGVHFYDYTKIPNRHIPDPDIYDLTFSYSGVPEFRRYVDKAIANKSRLAVVFRDKDKIPDTFKGMPVINGDVSDIRFREPQGVVVSLYAKGKAKYDTSGFVVD
jgi:hypothetical protein